MTPPKSGWFWDNRKPVRSDRHEPTESASTSDHRRRNETMFRLQLRLPKCVHPSLNRAFRQHIEKLHRSAENHEAELPPAEISTNAWTQGPFFAVTRNDTLLDPNRHRIPRVSSTSLARRAYRTVRRWATWPLSSAGGIGGLAIQPHGQHSIQKDSGLPSRKAALRW